MKQDIELIIFQGLQLDTSSESGYGSDQDSLKSQQEQQSSPTGAQGGSQVGGPPPLLPPRASPAPQQPALPPRLEKTAKKRVQFDSYVLFLQGLRERDLEMVQVIDFAFLLIPLLKFTADDDTHIWHLNMIL